MCSFLTLAFWQGVWSRLKVIWIAAALTYTCFKAHGEARSRRRVVGRSTRMKVKKMAGKGKAL
jgi:ABC-type maltose transport system permease subunit